MQAMKGLGGRYCRESVYMMVSYASGKRDLRDLRIVLQDLREEEEGSVAASWLAMATVELKVGTFNRSP